MAAGPVMAGVVVVGTAAGVAVAGAVVAGTEAGAVVAGIVAGTVKKPCCRLSRLSSPG